MCLEFSNNILRVLQLSELKEIVLKDEVDLGFNINNESQFRQNNNELIIEFGDKFSQIFKNGSNDILTAGIIIDTSQTFLTVVPIDFNEDQSSINSHILWELSNYFPDTYKNFNIKYYRLNNHFNDKIDEVLLIAVDKNKINFIKSLCNNNNIKIKNIEIDHFAVEKCLYENFSDEINSRNILIIGCKNSRFDFSLIAQGLIRYYDFENFEQVNIKSFILKQMNFFNLMFNDMNIQNVFLYGEDNSSLVKDILNEEFTNLSVSFINTIDENDNQNNFSQYAPLYGLALKNFT